jgi:acetoin utilization protein AcuB
MDFTAPISSIMTRKLITVMPSDRLTVVKEIFDTTRIHHIPVVKYTTLVGLISKVDIAQYFKGAGFGNYELVDISRLNNYTAEDIMTTGIATLESTDRINVALEVFAENLFHAIPIVDNGGLVGMLTTLDVIKALQEEDTRRIKSHQGLELSDAD